MKILDPGHRYQLLSLDGNFRQVLQFVKRFDAKDPSRFPGNTEAHPGTTLQDVIHCCLNRVRYLQNQIPCVENEMILQNLQQCLWLLENRAARRHGLMLPDGNLESLEMAQLCPECGHTYCRHKVF